MKTKILNQYIKTYKSVGYIAGSGDGIVTINGTPASRPVFLYQVSGGMALIVLVARQASLSNGHYLFMGLDPAKRYLVMCRDSSKEYEPFCWDYVVPATDLTIAEQQELWQSWQTQ